MDTQNDKPELKICSFCGGVKPDNHLQTYQKLKSEINYAKSSMQPRELLYQTYGKIMMARELYAITIEEYIELNHDCVADGINNPKYF